MRSAYAEGGNYRIEVRGPIAHCVVWKRPDVDSAQGAQFAREKIAHFTKLAEARATIGMVFDLRDAPPVIGPQTQEAIAMMLDAFAAAEKRIAVIVGPQAVQRLQLSRLVSDVAGAHGHVAMTDEEAEKFVRGAR